MLRAIIKNIILSIAVALLPTNAFAASCSLSSLLGNWMLYLSPADPFQKALVCQASATSTGGGVVVYTLSNCPETSYPYEFRILMDNSARCTYSAQGIRYTGVLRNGEKKEDYLNIIYITLNQNQNIFLGSTVYPSSLGYHYTIMGIRID